MSKVPLSTHLALLGTLTAVACSASPAQPDPLPGARGEEEAAPPLCFAWPVPGRAAVTEEVLKEGETAVMRYALVVEAGPRPDTVRVRYADFEFVSMAGRPLTPELTAQLAPLLAMARALPDIIVSSRGEALDVVGFDALMERVAAYLEAIGDAPRERTERLRATLADPHTQALIEQSVLDSWRAWVEAWAGLTLRPGEDQRTAPELSVPGVGTLVNPTVIRHEGPAPGAPDLVKLLLEARPDPEGIKEVWLATMAKLVGDAGGDPGGLDAGALERVERVTRVEAITDPATLRPAHVALEKRSTIKIAGRPEQSQVERRTYTFTWPPAPPQ